MKRVHVFMAMSLDGFIAGPNDELDWLQREGAEDTFTPFMQGVGAMLMGRRTYDVVSGFDGDWPYGETPVLVATSRPLSAARGVVTAVSGSITDLVDEAKAAAGERDVYLDGGALIRSALDAGLVDELTLTLIPTVLGAGLPLWTGVARRHELTLQSSRELGAGLVQLRYVPTRPSRSGPRS
ncbi:MAG: dihydrofolate reductase [Sandaracinaceae bacterium]|nr:dihydrofolate reductase [Sandaracinaceae bacterium]